MTKLAEEQCSTGPQVGNFEITASSLRDPEGRKRAG